MSFRFIGDRREHRVAFAAVYKRFRWFMELYPDDSMQIVYLSCVEVPEIGRPLLRTVTNNMRALMKELGYRRTISEGSEFWRKDEQDEFMQTRSIGMVYGGAPKCGTSKAYANGCRCDKCRAYKSAQGKKNYKPRPSCTKHPGAEKRGTNCLPCLREKAAMMNRMRRES